jgi:ferredoxin
MTASITPRATEAPRLTVNPIGCRAHGLCADLIPELIELDEWGYPILRDGRVPDALLPEAKAAVAACPTLALRISRAG